MNTTENDTVLENRIRETFTGTLFEVFTTPDDVIHLSFDDACCHKNDCIDPECFCITSWIEEFSGSDPIPKIRPFIN